MLNVWAQALPGHVHQVHPHLSVPHPRLALGWEQVALQSCESTK